MDIFSQCGYVLNLIMGLNKVTKEKCGFCFVEYSKRSEATQAIELLNKVMVDGR